MAESPLLPLAASSPRCKWFGLGSRSVGYGWVWSPVFILISLLFCDIVSHLNFIPSLVCFCNLYSICHIVSYLYQAYIQIEHLLLVTLYHLGTHSYAQPLLVAYIVHCIICNSYLYLI